jgi:hypothetical protein
MDPGSHGNIKMNLACTQCHQMGTKVTREVQPDLRAKFRCHGRDDR